MNPAATSDPAAQNVVLRQALRDLANHKAGTEPTNDVVEAFQILEDETEDRNRLFRRVMELELEVQLLRDRATARQEKP